MDVRDLMTWEVQSCHPDMDLGTVAMMLWEQDCGIVPVLERGTDRLVGVVTDRDICMATATKGRKPAKIAVSEIMNGAPRSCLPDDDLHAAMDSMADAQVHRLPVVDESGVLKGLLSMNDLILASGPGGKRGGPVPDGEVMEVLRAVSRHRKHSAIMSPMVEAGRR